MIPPPWAGIILTLAAYRILRLISWDDLPPILKLRAKIIGEHWVPADEEGISLPGKTPDSEVSMVRPAYTRPLLAHFVHCPFCMGFWVSCATYVAWLLIPTQTLYVAVPFALSGAIGLISKNWDA